MKPADVLPERKSWLEPDETRRREQSYAQWALSEPDGHQHLLDMFALSDECRECVAEVLDKMIDTLAFALAGERLHNAYMRWVDGKWGADYQPIRLTRITRTVRKNAE